MRNPLYKTLKKEFKQNLTRYLSIMMILVVMIGAVSGFLTVAYGYKDELSINQQECLVEDGQFTLTTTLSQETINKIEDKSLKLYENFYSEQDITDSTTIRLFKNRTDVNKATLSSGRLPENEHEIAIDRLFAKKNHYEIGTTIRIHQYSVKIVGLISVPDYSSLIQKSSDLMMDPIHFGIAVVDDKSFHDYAKDNISYQYSYLTDQKLSDKGNYDLLNDIKDICLQDGYQLTQMMTAQMNQCISFLPNDMGSDIPMIQTLLYIMVVILAFIFVVISQTIIEEQSTVIGTLLANGYTKKEIVQHYMMLPLIITVIACVIGNILGYTLFPPLFDQMYSNSYCLPPLEIHFIQEAFISTTIIPFLFMMIVLYMMLNHKLKISPLRFLRRDLRKQKKRRYIHLKEKSFIKRFQKRILLQNKGTYIMLFFGIFFASFIFLFGFMMTPSINHYLENMEASIHASYQYVLKAALEVEGGEKVTLTSLETYYDQGDLDLDVTIYGLQNKSQYYDIDLPKEKNHIIINYDLAHKLNVEKGDQIIFTNPYTEKEYYLIVDDMNDDKGTLSVLMSQELCNQMLGENEDYFNGYLSNQSLDIDDQYIQSLITKEDMTKIGEQLTTSFAQMIPIMTSVSLVIYFVVIYILTKLVLDRNTLYMSFLKVMGYENKEIKKLYLHATTRVVVISLIVSIPLCVKGLELLLQVAFMQFAGYMEAYIPLYLYGLVFITGLLTYLIVNFVLTKQIKKIHIGESLKDME